MLLGLNACGFLIDKVGGHYSPRGTFTTEYGDIIHSQVTTDVNVVSAGVNLM